MAIIRLGSQNSAYLIFRRQLHVPFKHHLAVHIHGQCFDAYAQLLDELGQPGVLLEQDKGIGVESGENEKVQAYPETRTTSVCEIRNTGGPKIAQTSLLYGRTSFLRRTDRDAGAERGIENNRPGLRNRVQSDRFLMPSPRLRRCETRLKKLQTRKRARLFIPGLPSHPIHSLRLARRSR